MISDEELDTGGDGSSSIVEEESSVLGMSSVSSMITSISLVMKKGRMNSKSPC